MTDSFLSQMAALLLGADADTQTYIGEFQQEHGEPPIAAFVAMYRLNLVQIGVRDADNLELGPKHTEAGRVEIREIATGRRVVLRSEATAGIENRLRQDSLFGASEYSDASEEVCVYAFTDAGLELFMAGAARKEGRQRVFVVGEPAFVGAWPYTASDAPLFDQGDDGDAFGDLGTGDKAGEEDAE